MDWVKTRLISPLLVLLLLSSCNREDKVVGIAVDIEYTGQVSIFDLFEKVELIPLETSDHSLLVDISKIQIYEDDFYILDYPLSRVLIFNNQGKFVNSIDHWGVGPGEYISISDFNIDNQTELTLLSPDNWSMYYYNLDGSFKNKVELPVIGRAYKSFQFLNRDTIIFWTFDEKNRIKFYSLKEDRIIKEAFPEEDNYFNSFSIQEFPYGNYLSRSSQNTVFGILPSCDVKVAYTWNFGKLNNSKKQLLKAPKFFSDPHEMQSFVEDVYSSKNINYIFNYQGGNEKYLYTQIIRENNHINIFHTKETQENYLFILTSEQAGLYPVYWTDEYIVGIQPSSVELENVVPDILLDEENKKKKQSISEMDNPVLIKYYFKSRSCG